MVKSRELCKDRHFHMKWRGLGIPRVIVFLPTCPENTFVHHEKSASLAPSLLVELSKRQQTFITPPGSLVRKLLISFCALDQHTTKTVGQARKSSVVRSRTISSTWLSQTAACHLGTWATTWTQRSLGRPSVKSSLSVIFTDARHVINLHYKTITDATVSHSLMEASLYLPIGLIKSFGQMRRMFMLVEVPVQSLSLRNLVKNLMKSALSQRMNRWA